MMRWSSASNSDASTPRKTASTANSRQSPHSPKGSEGRAARGRGPNRTQARPAAGRELCGYAHRVCLQNRLEGFEYCIRHILVDRNAPFKQCIYVHPHSAKRCPNAARRTERKDSTLCPWHIKKMYLKRKNEQDTHRHGRSLSTAQKTLPSLLRDLEHLCPEEHPKRRRAVDWVKQDDDTTTATDDLRERIAEAAANLDSDSDEECHNPLIDGSLRADVIDSDSETVCSDQDDSLRHAGVYTAEEVSSILSEKMHRLQKLYIDQFKHLKFLLKEKYRKYYQNALNEGPGMAHSPDDMPDDNDRAKFKALVRYHRYHGKEALLKREAKEKRRAVIEARNYQPPSFPVCIYVKGDEVCKSRSLPSSHYCFNHILFDVHQVLFRPCANGQPPCLNPVVSFVHNNTCIAHRQLKADKNIVKKLISGQEDMSTAMGSSTAEPELFQTMDDIASLQLDAVVPTSYFALDQYGDLGASVDMQ